MVSEEKAHAGVVEWLVGGSSLGFEVDKLS